jgi:hypothetical protein
MEYLLFQEILMAICYTIKLSSEEREELTSLVKSNQISSKTVKYSQALLMVASGPEGPAFGTRQIEAATLMSPRTIERLKKRMVEGGIELALERKKPPFNPSRIKCDGVFEAKLIALACSPPPDGRSRWSLRLLEDKVVELGYIDSIDHSTIGRILNRNQLKPHLSKYWKIPPDQSAAFVASMEEVLDTYQLPYNSKVPVVCMDESSIQLVEDVVTPIPCSPGTPMLVDHEYIRNGVANIFIVVEPLSGQRTVQITKNKDKG